MSSLMPQEFTSSGLPARVERQLSRQVATIQARAVVQAAQQSSKVAVIEEVVESAMLATARVGQLEGLLSAQTPEVAGRLRFIAEAGALGMGAVVQQTARKVM